MKMSRYTYRQGMRKNLYYGHGRDTPPFTPKPMTQKQIRDLQAFAIELTREGRHDAARQVLLLIGR
jgi:hypothetical protein